MAPLEKGKFVLRWYSYFLITNMNDILLYVCTLYHTSINHIHGHISRRYKKYIYYIINQQLIGQWTVYIKNIFDL